MKVLILSCNTGEGHNAAAKAIATALHTHGDHCDIVDALGFLSPATSDFVGNWHVRIYKHSPFLFNAGYKIMEKGQDGSDDLTILARLLMKGTDKLIETVENGDYDKVICTHPFSAYMYTLAKREHPLKPKSAFVATDYTCAPPVDKTRMDTYFIPHETLKNSFISCFVPEHKLCPSGIPVRSVFYEKVEKEEAKLVLGIPENKRNVLLACGSMGCGPLKDLAVELAKKLPSDAYLTVICGNNHKLKRKLDKLKLPQNVRVLGFTGNISLYMDSAEFIITKAGGLTCTEALAKKLPMLLIGVIGGCEKYNRRFFIDGGMAIEPKRNVADYAVKLFKSPAKLSAMAEAMKKTAPGNSTEQIFHFLHREDN